MVIKKSKFTEWIVRENALSTSGFQEWFFYPGMLFNTMDKWWGHGEKRNKPHEGLDLCFYKNRKGSILQLDDSIKIPVLYDGVVVRVMDDFMGKSVVVEHCFAGTDPLRLITIYGHTTPLQGLNNARIVKEGELIATLAKPEKFQSNVPPHLHLSVGWLLESISYENLEWATIKTLSTLIWIDPLQTI